MLFETACRKIDTSTSPDVNQGSAAENRFFNTHRTTDPTEKKLMEYLRHQNNKLHFVEQTAMQIGFPRWDKIMAFPKQHTSSANLLDNQSDSVYYIPFVRDSQNYVNATLRVSVAGSDTSFSYLCDWQYSTATDSSTGTIGNAEKFAVFFMRMDKEVFNYQRFILKDSSLFKDGRSIVKNIRFDTVDASISNLNSYELMCVMTAVTRWEACPPGSASAVLVPGCEYTYWYQVCWWEWAGDLPDNGGGLGGGGSTGGGTPPPCGGPVGFAAKGNGNTSQYNEPCGPGWEPEPIEDEPPLVPYVCSYELTQYEQTLFNQLNAEDAFSDQEFQISDCKGTKRTGNINFQGTKEHWLIQLDYLYTNPTYGESEFAIPGSSAAGNKGYADIANTLNGNIFEIKPDNDNGLISGTTEVNRYVDKANLHCTGVLPFGVAFNKGNTYTARNIPTSIPNRYLTARLAAPGVIGYEYNTLTNPIPAPVTVPVTVIDKFRHLIDRLRGNLSQADKIIAEYMQQNPDLVNYIKSAAVGAGVAVVVGTILEDFLTLGGGIADDLPCFILAYRIVRFAWAL